MTMMQMVLETAIKEAGDFNDIQISKLDALYILDILKKYEPLTELVQLPEPDCCKNCKSISSLVDETTWYCHMNTILPENVEMDISAIQVNPDKKPSWCPITKVNKYLKKLEPEERERANIMLKGLALMFGNEHMLSAVKEGVKQDK